MHDKKLYGTATVGTKGQVVIPADAREEIGIMPGDRLYVLGSSTSGFVGLLKEDQIESYIETMNLHIETFKSLQKSKDQSE